jgi:hypothetical protein
MRMHLQGQQPGCLFQYSRSAKRHRRRGGIRQNQNMDALQPGPYRHFKGSLYEVVGEARHSETEERLAVYRAPSGELWVRPLDMFLGTALVDGVAVQRFERL